MEAPANDKKRLSQIQTQDLTESKVNDDFVLWLKTHGMNVLLVVLIAACAVLGYRYFQRQALDKASTAWSDFAAAALPESLEQIAVHCLERKPHHHRLLWLCHQILFERILRASASSPAAGSEPRA